jgi:uracil-DNA glycosylase
MTKYGNFNFDIVHSSWHSAIQEGLSNMDPDYLNQLYQTEHWLPGPDKIFNAFSLPVSKVKYVLFGESPYPREKSANGFAFWDAAVNELWSEKGLSKTVNRATSLRNIIKMLLIAENLLDANHTTQENIAQLKKTRLISTNQALFQHLLDRGFLLLNATLILQPKKVRKDAYAWHPFIKTILDFLHHEQKDIQLILLGNIANIIDKLLNHHGIKTFYAEHPYNISFITNPKVIAFFRPFHLLLKK